MAVSVFPIPSSSGSSGPFAYAASIPAATTKYKHTQAFAAGVYTITSSPTYAATVTFYDATSLIVETVTVSGTITINLATPATYVIISVVTGACTVSISLTANSLVSTSLSGTLDTITTTGNYNQTGPLYVLCFGGGASGSVGNNGGHIGGKGGGQTASLVYTNAATLVTLGASNGTTTFGNLVTATSGGTGAANSGPAAVSTAIQPQIINATTGGGGTTGNFNGNTFNSPTNGAVGNIGTGGAGSNGNGGNATGYASGGGGSLGGTAGAGSPGIVYVLRGF